jgi:signal transduction histidine kinase
LLEPVEREAARERLRLTEAGAAAPEMWEASFLCGGGPPVIAEVTALPFTEQGHPSVLLLGLDVTEQRQFMARMMSADRMVAVGTLAAGVAHEINNPIGFVSSNLGSLRRYVEALLKLVAAYGRHRQDMEQDAELAALEQAADLDYIADDLPELLKESEEGLSRVKKIVQDLKDFSRVDSADWQDADINAGIESTLNVVMNEVKYRADVERQYGQLPPVRCLAGQLNQVFMNLIVNAAHAIEGKRGLVELRSGCEDRDGQAGVWIEVSDNGKGMSPEVQRRIFEPFFTTKPVGQGTGLGLSLSFSIVQKHGGAIEVSSTPGQGTCFKVWVPVAGPQSR